LSFRCRAPRRTLPNSTPLPSFLQVPPSLGNDHGDHSHDDLDQHDHHHADHTHKKAGFVGTFANSSRIAIDVDFAISSDTGVGGLLDPLERPPRMA